jgi:hypothetical protein
MNDVLRLDGRLTAMVAHPVVMSIGIVIFIVCWFGAVYSWLMAVKNRVPGQSFWRLNGFNSASFTGVGLVYRRRFFLFWLVGLMTILVVILLNPG